MVVSLKFHLITEASKPG